MTVSKLGKSIGTSSPRPDGPAPTPTVPPSRPLHERHDIDRVEPSVPRPQRGSRADASSSPPATPVREALPKKVASSDALRAALRSFNTRYETVRFQQSEFPNPFLLLARGATLDTKPSDISQVELARIRRLTERAVQSVASRITLPLKRGNELELVRLDQALLPSFQSLDDSVQPLLSAGVARSLISFVVDQMYEGMLLPEPRTPEETLHALIGDTSDIPGLNVRGVGSDFDLFVHASTPQLAEAGVQRVKAALGGGAASYVGSDMNEGFAKAIFLTPDAKTWEGHLERTLKSGGVTVDLLGFDLRAGRFIEPPPSPTLPSGSIVDELLLGRYTYAPPAGMIENPEDTALRGLRPLFELPWAELDEEGRMRLEADLQSVLSKIQEGRFPLPGNRQHERAMNQWSKMVRNGARYGFAHNRAYRSGPGSVEALGLRIARELANGKTTLLPQFVDWAPIDRRTDFRSGLNGLPPELLMDPRDFVQSFTDGGKLYHGTQHPLAILRQGLFLSTSDQGTAVYGRGAYTTADRNMALSYAGSRGVVLELDVDASRPFHVLEWGKAQVQNSPFIRALIDRCPDRDTVFEKLAREHGVDVIVNGHVLLQNSDVAGMPKDIGGLVRSYASTVENPRGDPEGRVTAFRAYAQLFAYAKTLSSGEVPPLGALTGHVLRIGEDPSVPPAVRLTALGLVKSVRPQLSSSEREHKAPVPALVAAVADVLRTAPPGELPSAVKLYQELLPELPPDTAPPMSLREVGERLRRNVHADGDLLERLEGQELVPTYCAFWNALSEAEREQIDHPLTLATDAFTLAAKDELASSFNQAVWTLDATRGTRDSAPASVLEPLGSAVSAVLGRLAPELADSSMHGGYALFLLGEVVKAQLRVETAPLIEVLAEQLQREPVSAEGTRPAVDSYLRVRRAEQAMGVRPPKTSARRVLEEALSGERRQKWRQFTVLHGSRFLSSSLSSLAEYLDTEPILNGLLDGVSAGSLPAEELSSLARSFEAAATQVTFPRNALELVAAALKLAAGEPDAEAEDILFRASQGQSGLAVDELWASLRAHPAAGSLPALSAAMQRVEHRVY